MFTVTFWLCSCPLAVFPTDSLFGTNQSQFTVTAVCDCVVYIEDVAISRRARGNPGIRTAISCLKKEEQKISANSLFNQEIYVSLH